MKIQKLLAACTFVLVAIAISGCADGSATNSCPFTECGGQCVDTNHDVSNCGGCGVACSAGEVCSVGACTLSCPVGLVDCGGSCVDPDTNGTHCGATADCQGANAGVACAAGEVCNGSGTCALTCQAGLVDCNGTCVNPDTDEAYCGASGDCQDANAGVVCAAGERCDGSACVLSCQAGLIDCNNTCVDPNNDEAYCGATGDCQGANNGDVCAAGEQCNGSGVCALSCQSGLIDCSGTCIDPDSNPTYCGATAGCAGYTTCSDTETCAEGLCVVYIPPCTLYAIDSNRAIYQVNKTTAALSLVATAGAAANLTAALAYRNDTGTVYVSSTTGDTLSTLNIGTGAVNIVGTYTNAAAVVMHGLEWNSWTGKLYGMSSHDGGLYEINPSTGAETFIGLSGTDSFGNLGFDSRNGVMYMTSGDTDSAYTINLTTGAATLLGPLNTMGNPHALAYDAENDVMYVLDSSDDELGVLNRTTGAVATIGDTSGNLLGLVCVPN